MFPKQVAPGCAPGRPAQNAFPKHVVPQAGQLNMCSPNKLRPRPASSKCVPRVPSRLRPKPASSKRVPKQVAPGSAPAQNAFPERVTPGRPAQDVFPEPASSKCVPRTNCTPGRPARNMFPESRARCALGRPAQNVFPEQVAPGCAPGRPAQNAFPGQVAPQAGHLKICSPSRLCPVAP